MSRPDYRLPAAIALLGALLCGCRAREARMISSMDLNRHSRTVTEGLRWLKRTQHPGGAWRSHRPAENPGLTALVLLAFLGQGSTDRRPEEFASTVAKAVDSLVARCARDGSIGEGMADRAMCSWALSEFTMMGSGPRRDAARTAAQRTIDSIVRRQGNNGLFDNGDVYVTLWQPFAIKSALAARLNVPGPAVAKMNRALDLTVASGYGTRPRIDDAGRRHGEPTIRLTAMSLAARFVSGRDRRDPHCVGQLAWLTRDNAHLKTVRAAKDLETVQFIVNALFHAGGACWRDMWAAARPALAAHQVKHGPLRGSWPAETHADRVRATAFACLSLEVYFTGISAPAP